MDTYTDIEKRVRALEQRNVDLTNALASTANLAAKAAQDAGQASGDNNGVGTQTIFNCITTSAVTARSGTTMGAGSFQFVDSTGGVLATLSAVGTFTGYTDSATGWANGERGRVTFMNGHWEFITADAC
jgi:type IV secretory pathway TrbL component